MIKSYYDLKITGKDTKRFIHNLHKIHIEFLNIEFINNSVIIKVTEVDYRKILDIKTIYEIEVINVYGIAYIKRFIKKYWLFFMILSFGILMFLGLTNIIFEVEVVHNNKDLRNLIIDELKTEGISKYNFIKTYEKKEKIKENILKKHKNKIEWLEIERQGTKYIIKVEERKKDDQIVSDKPQNIVAKKNGLIKKIFSSSGEIVVKKDQYVKKGEILISGTIHNKEEEVAKIHAKGEIYAETWYTVTVELPYHYREEKKTDRSQKVIDIKWFNHSFHLLDFEKYKNTNEQNIFEIRNNLLPISISLINQQEVEIIDKIYTKNNAENEASEIAKKRLRNNLGENIQILYEKNLKITEEDSKIIVVMFYKVYENITAYQEITEIINEPKKEE